jgi:hypothetical protein
MSNSKRPVPNVPALALIFNIIGGLVLLGAIAAGVGVGMQWKSAAGANFTLLPLIGSAVFTGALFLGAAEVIQLIARVAIEAGRSADAAERTAVAAETQSKPRLFLYHVGNEVRGPVTIEVLRSLRSVKGDMRQVSGESLACRVGETEWKRLAEFMDK